MRNFIVIAIDGAAASGKTSTSLRIADKYHLMVSSTGMHYRAITLALIKNGITPEANNAIAKFLQSMQLDSHVAGNTANITINGMAFAEQDLRSPTLNEVVAKYSSIAEIRKSLFNYQRHQAEIARKNNFAGLVMEGRDITSVIFPDADLKFFLEANAQERSRRREQEQEKDNISKRDQSDQQRTICSAGVYKIDTGINDLETVVNIISSKIDQMKMR